MFLNFPLLFACLLGSKYFKLHLQLYLNMRLPQNKRLLTYLLTYEVVCVSSLYAAIDRSRLCRTCNRGLMLNMNQIAVLRACRGSTTWNNYVAAVGDKFNLASFVIRRVNCRPCILCAAIVDWPAILLLYRNLRFYTEGRLVEYCEIWDTLSLSQFACSAFIALSNVVSFVFCSCSRSND